MGMGTRQAQEKQEAIWIASVEVARSPGHPFYERLNELLDGEKFDRFVEGLCRKFYAPRMGRPGLAPGINFRSLRIGYFEGIDSELKRQLVHVAGFNLSLIFRKLLGAGTPREWKNRGGAPILFILALFTRRERRWRPCRGSITPPTAKRSATPLLPVYSRQCPKFATSTTGC